MAFEFLKSLHQASLEKEFNARPARPAKDPMPKRREVVAASAGKALAALKAGEDKPKGGIYRMKPNTDVVECKVKYGSRTLVLGGADKFYTKDAVAFYKGIQDAATKGELDEAINAAVEGKGGPAKSTGGAKRTMSPEHRAKIAEAARRRHAANKAK